MSPSHLSPALRLACAALIMATAARSEVLNSFVRHYEPLTYNHHDMMWQHHRLRRSFTGPRDLSLQFTAFGRDFDLQLVPDRSLLSKDFRLTTNGGREIRKHHLKSLFYEGADRNDPSVRIHGNVANGVFEGSMNTDDEMYFIERADKYLNDTEHHSIIYRKSDLDLSSVTGATCGSTHTDIREHLAATQWKTNEDNRRLTKRQTNFDPQLVRCRLLVIGDYEFFLQHSNAGDPTATRILSATSQLLSLISTASRIFEQTDFDEDSSPDNIHFGVVDLEIISEPLPASDPFANQFLGVQAFLTEHSRADHSEYCLAYRFTHRDFDDGVLGLAYVAETGAAGGICDDFSSSRGMTLNTGIVTTLNYGRLVATAVSALTFAHEAGHNFGSNHDPLNDPTCSPSSGGNYIMSARASAATQPNNDEFSPCSVDMMRTQIRARGQDNPNGCFVRADDRCGNRLIDDGEDCDCGRDLNPDGSCMADECCNGTTCLLATGMDCSPDQGPCCTTGCMFVTGAAMLNCSAPDECALAQICNGSSAQCPVADARPVNESIGFNVCNDGNNICINETCSGSVCAALQLEDCECADIELACDVCCVLSNGTCESTLRIAADESTSDLASRLPDEMGRTLQVGFPCGNFSGYCDFFNRCMVVDSEGALIRLANIFFSSDTITNVIDWITDMWWAVLLIGIGVLLIMFFIVLVFHLVLPRPGHVKNRAERRRTIRRQRAEKADNPVELNHQQGGYYQQQYL